MDGMVCSVWLRMSLTGEERGQRRNRVVKAAREDGAEKCEVIYVFENHLLTRRNIKLDREFAGDA